MPALKAQGITDKEGIAEHMGRFLSNQYAAQLGVIFATQSPRIEKDIALKKSAGDLGAAKAFTQDDVKIAGMGLWNAIKSDIASDSSRRYHGCRARRDGRRQSTENAGWRSRHSR
jgi:hypothetical protein